ncbi:MAG: response regulator [Flammeovirgaceae bacterium]|jgi:two-component SAPR family response regulator|nr:response regulator [Flammeovirgaceae bacterium]
MIRPYPVEKAYLIDDSEVDLFVHKKFIELRHLANEIVTFTSPSQALEKMATIPDNEAPGILFLDLNMPIINGFEFLEKAKHISSDVFKRMRVVILTSSNSIADRERAQAFDNVISFIPKPLTVQGIDDIIKLIGTDK